MKFAKPQSYAELLRSVLPEYEPASKICYTVTQAPGWHNCNTPQERDAFEDRWRREESTKWYKAIDGAGEVFLIRNPIGFKVMKDAQGRIIRLRQAPQHKGNVTSLIKEKNSSEVAGKKQVGDEWF